jgi:hypothetical protein
MNRKLILMVVVLVVNLLAGAMVLMGQDTPPPPAGTPFTSASSFNRNAIVGQSAILEGTLTWVFGDPQSALDRSRFVATVWDRNGNAIAEFPGASGELFKYYMKTVRISGQVISTAATNRPASLNYMSIESSSAPSGLVFATTTGAQPFINIQCKFSDVSDEPRTNAYIQSMFSNSYPNLDHYFRDMSYNAINLVGTQTVGFFTIGPTNDYLYFDPFYGEFFADTNLIADDCVGAADPTVNFAGVAGINIMLNESLDCCAYGGSYTYTNLDGANRTIRTTWDPPWAQTYHVLGHEMGHAFGMPHSTGPSVNPPTGLNVYVSVWDVMSDAAGRLTGYANINPNVACVSDLATGCIAQGMIAPQLLYPGWILAADQALVPRTTAQSVLLERVRNQPVGSDDLIARIPTTAAAFDDFYTVEVRENSGYDFNNMVQIGNNPNWTTLIHLVDTSRDGQDGQPLIVTAGNSTAINGPAAMWQAGESFVDATRNVTINVIAREGNAVRVNIGNNIGKPANDAIAAASLISTVPFNASPNTLLATQESGDPNLSCIGNQKGFYTVWYRHTATSNRNLIFSTAASGYDTVVGVFSGSPGSLIPVACNDDDGASPQARVQFTTVSGTTYYMAVASRLSSTFGNAQVNLSESLVLAIPTLLTPADGATTDDNTPTFTWGSVGSATSYEIAFEQSNPPVNAVIVTTTTYTPPALPPGNYFWRVRARNAGGPGDWSPIRTLILNSASTSAPNRNHFNVAQPPLSWLPITNAVSYDLQIAVSSTFSPLTYSVDAIPGLNHPVGAPLATGTYFWRVRARFANGTFSPWSVADTFTIDPVP